MGSSKVIRLKSLITTATGGVIFGVLIEKYRSSNVSFAATSLPAPQVKFPEVEQPNDDQGFPIGNYKSKSERINHIVRHHGYPSTEILRVHENYVLSYDSRNKTANWVLEHLNNDILNHNPPSGKDGQHKIDRSKSEFKEDPIIHPYFRSNNSDYKNSGYDRGHLAAAGNHKLSQEVINSTFYLSNISPQVGQGFNRDSWNNLERYVRYRAQRAKNLWICTGPLYLPRRDFTNDKFYVKFQVIGSNNVSVPTHFFKVILIEENDGSLSLESYLMPNQSLDSKIPLKAYQVPIDSIERSAGFLIFNQIPKNFISKINSRENSFLEKFHQKLLQDEQKFSQQNRRQG